MSQENGFLDFELDEILAFARNIANLPENAEKLPAVRDFPYFYRDLLRIAKNSPTFSRKT